MIKFRQKKFTIPEGHYTGPKDMDDIPGAAGLIAKGALGGAGVGAVVGALMKDNTATSGAYTGAKFGAVSGVLAKLLLNYMHKPMNSLKYQEVDSAIRRQFGIFRVSGVTVGDSIDKRSKLDEKFSFNDRNVSEYKINIAICDNKFTMYTFGMSNSELDQTSAVLDYYCKKYYGMEYDAKVINARVNSYSVAIAFTNGVVINDFIMELSEKLKTKINLLDSKAIVLPRLESAATSKEVDEEVEEPKETNYSVSGFTTFDLSKLLAKGAMSFGLSKALWKTDDAAYTMLPLVIDASENMSINDKQRAGVPVQLGQLNNLFLEKTLKKLHYVESMDYTTFGSMGAKGLTNMSVGGGVLFITVGNNSKDYPELEKKFYKPLQGILRRSAGPGATCYIYPIKSEKEFEAVINKLMSCKVKPNIFNETLRDTTGTVRKKLLGTLKKVF